MRARRSLTCVLGAVLLVAAGPLVAAPAVRSTMAQHEKLALELTTVMVPKAMVQKIQDRVIAQGLEHDKELAELEKSYPGLTEHLRRNLSVETSKTMETRYPERMKIIASFFAEKLSAADISSVTALYRSPAGQKALGFIGAKADIPGASAAAKGPEAKFEGRDFAPSEAMAAKLMAQFTPAESAQIRAFYSSPRGMRWRAILPTYSAKIAEVINGSVVEDRARLTVFMTSIARDFIDQHPASPR